MDLHNYFIRTLSSISDYYTVFTLVSDFIYYSLLSTSVVSVGLQCIISALAGYGEDGDGSGELDDEKEADQHLMINNALQKTVYIASMYVCQLPTNPCRVCVDF